MKCVDIFETNDLFRSKYSLFHLVAKDLYRGERFSHKYILTKEEK